MSDLENRIGITPLDELLAQRAELVDDVAPLRARYGPGGTWDHRRKVKLSTIAQKIRAQNAVDGVKMTEAAINDAAHADDEYGKEVELATVERDRMMHLEDQIQAINDRINRDNALTYYAKAEVGLAR